MAVEKHVWRWATAHIPHSRWHKSGWLFFNTFAVLYEMKRKRSKKRWESASSKSYRQSLYVYFRVWIHSFIGHQSNCSIWLTKLTLWLRLYLTSYLRIFYSQMSPGANMSKMTLSLPLPTCVPGESGFTCWKSTGLGFGGRHEQREQRCVGSKVKTGLTVARHKEQLSRIYL